jgi:hypothetical protein
MSKQQEAEELYLQIQKAYSPTYFPSEDERSDAIFQLTNFLFGKTSTKSESSEKQLSSRLFMDTTRPKSVL